MQKVLFMIKLIEISLFLILLFSSITWGKKILFILIIYIFYLINHKLNTVLKNTFKIKLENKKIIKQKLESGNKQIYGMPSGHAQRLSFYLILSYLFFINTKYFKNITSKYIYILTCVTLIVYIWEFILCILYKYHTVAEYIVGTICGGFVAYVTFILLLKINNKK
jgi:hypothetical protein